MQLNEPSKPCSAPYAGPRAFCARLLAILFLAATLPWAAAQNTNNLDTQAKYDPPSAPGAGQKFLQDFVGQWAVERRFHPRNGEPTVVKGECTQKMIHAGRFLESDFVFHEGTNDVTGTGLIGFEPATGFFTSVWVDSSSTRMSIRQSKTPFDGSEIVMFAQALGTNGVREARVSRNETHLLDNKRKIVHQQFVTNPDNTERLMLELIMTKTGP